MAALTGWYCGDEQRVIDHYETPLNVGSFDKKLAEVGTGELTHLALRPQRFRSRPTDQTQAKVGVQPLRTARLVPDASEGPGLVGAPACGDVMKLQIKVKDGKIEEAVFKAKPKPDGPPPPRPHHTSLAAKPLPEARNLCSTIGALGHRLLT